MKISTICFILLVFLLAGAVSATTPDNETLKHPADDESHTELKASVISDDALKASQTTTSSPAKAKVTLKAPDVRMYYKDGKKFTVTVKDQSKKAVKNVKVKITINGQAYTKTTDSKGKATVNLNLKSGTYSALTSFQGSSKYEKASIKSTITVKSTVKAGDFSKYYTSKSPYSAKFYDKKGKLLKDASVKFKINSKTYSLKTSSKGVAKLNIDLKPGKYTITLTNTPTSESVTKTVTINSILQTKDMTVTQKSNSSFTVKVLNSYGKVSPNKKVTLTVNGSTFTVKTNNEGIAAHAINLLPGKYTITTQYGGLKNTNTITVN